MISIQANTRPRPGALFRSVLACIAFVGGARNAGAVEIPVNPDWTVNWDNTPRYALGIRAQSIDPRIGNNPAFAESDYKFSRVGDVVTNRLSDFTELDAVYAGKYGFRLSATFFKDAAYDGGVNTNPGDYAPGVPYTALHSYQNNQYPNYTKSYYKEGFHGLDAFAFGQWDIGGHHTTVKLGRLTEFWGNSLFFGAQGIDYSQNASDQIKGSSQPGSLAKELALPREQVLVSTQVTPEASVEAEYFLHAAQNVLPEGGTYLGAVGFLFRGPQYMLGKTPRGQDVQPSNSNPNYGLKVAWTPDWLRGTLSAYYRRLDEVQPWAPLIGTDPVTGASNFHLTYATDVDLFGLSLEKQIGDYSTGFEVSYRAHTALNSISTPVASDPLGTDGPRGNTVNLIANIQGGLSPSALYQTGTWTAEIAATQLLTVTRNGSMYTGTNNATGCATHSRWSGCSTKSAVAIASTFDPVWLQVVRGVDLDMPLFVQYGIYGNPASLGTSPKEGGLNFTAGLHALIKTTYNVTLQYNGYHAHTSRGTTPIDAGATSIYTSGNGNYFYNDRGWVSLVLSTSF